MKLCRTIVLTLIFLLLGTTAVWAGDVPKKPLSEAFYNAVVLPLDYHDKAFVNGRKTDVRGDYKLYLRNDRILVPIRLMGYLATEVDRNNQSGVVTWAYWEVVWDAQKPKEVLLSNHKLHKTVKLTVNSKTMFVNDEPQTLDVPPQNINGRIVLPLRAAAEALGKNVEWFDGLVIISNDMVDLHSPQAEIIKNQMKVKLDDTREPVGYQEQVTPLAKYQDEIFYVKTNYEDSNNIQELYKQTPGSSGQKVRLPGLNNFSRSQVINDELYYTTTINGKIELRVFNLAAGQSRKLCDLDQDYSWLGTMKYIDDDFYFVLHYGDLTMGSETLYKLVNGQAHEVASAKTFISFEITGDYLYYTEFYPPAFTNNLYRVNLETGAKENFGEQGFTYGVNRTIREGGGVSYSGNPTLYFKDGYLYILGYQETDQEDKSSVFRINLEDLTQERISSPARNFWLIAQQIYYVDSGTGDLVKMDLDGNSKITISDQQVIDLQAYEGNIYYTAAKNDTAAHKFYQYNIKSGQQTLLTNQSVQNFFVGKTGIYYQTDGYELGLYKVGADDNTTLLVNDTIDSALITDMGMVYTLRYQAGIYTVQ
ncbi:DUF5050 domain-containing protein [Metallumcola ferriviriculae]|uniref:DUF5050 domain-containing protein n=1 Tax=Metallumcola ferriviriculae TaxID=3039180 RepID=A0AAU0UPI8_9FIRM|nr:DUF5050 domain-containing protein [Desulfitibacteraceae bacterium MK1]